MKRKFTGVFIALLLINVSLLFAQGTPCGDSGDPDVPSECPLDTWVFLLVGIFGIFAIYQLQKNNLVYKEV